MNLCWFINWYREVWRPDFDGEERHVSDVPGDAEGGLIDLSGLSLRDLDKLGDSSLMHELRRLFDGGDEEAEIVAGFNNTV
jgi:FXSXX-COOH protein